MGEVLMINNDILRRLRYTFDLGDAQMITIFNMADLVVTREQISNWLKKDDDPDFISCHDQQFATFLNGFINYKRGKQEGEQPAPEARLSNNQIFKKLTIALTHRADDVLEILGLAEFSLSKHELSSFFRKPGHKHFRECKDQVLRNYLAGLQLKYRDEPIQAPVFEWKIPPVN
jgi:uncharacterized protein YehS (DUF1456 family)